MTEVFSEVIYRKSYGDESGYIIDENINFYAADDAHTVTFWDGDFPLIVTTKQADGTWRVTAGDGDWVPFSDAAFASPDAAIEAYGSADPRYAYRERTDADDEI